jgi:hypothetical protein
MNDIRDEIVTCMGDMYPFVGIQIPISQWEIPANIGTTGDLPNEPKTFSRSSCHNSSAVRAGIMDASGTKLGPKSERIGRIGG